MQQHQFFARGFGDNAVEDSDTPAVLGSVAKTGRSFLANDEPKTSGARTLVACHVRTDDIVVEVEMIAETAAAPIRRA